VRLVSALAIALYVILTVFVPVLVAVVGLVLVQRLVPPERREGQNDVAGFIYAVLGVAYAVLLAFVVIAVWQDYETAKTNVDSEANELAGVYFLASQLPEPQRTRLQDLARTYARVVVEEEWPMMERGQTSPRADSLVSQLRLEILEFDPHTKGEQVLYERGLTQLHDAVDARRSRLVEVSASRGVGRLLERNLTERAFSSEASPYVGRTGGESMSVLERRLGAIEAASGSDGACERCRGLLVTVGHATTGEFHSAECNGEAIFARCSRELNPGEAAVIRVRGHR